MGAQLEKLKVAVAGTSFAGAVQIPVFQSFNRTEVVAVSSGRHERAAEVAAEHGIRSSYTDFVQMLDRERPDIVSIVTPTSLHCPMAVAALDRGIHVLCEKPFAMNASEGATMCAAAARSGRTAMVDFEFRYLPARAYMLKLIRDGYAGEIRMAEFSQRRGWRTRAADASWNWWSDATQGGGLLGALASHAVDSLRLWLGNARRVFCDLAIFVPERDGQAVTADDSFTMLLDYQTGARAVSQMTSVAGIQDARIGVFGTDGQLVVPDVGLELWGARRGEAPHRLEIPEEFRQPPEAHLLRAPFRALLRDFVAAIDAGIAAPSPNFADGLESQRILDAARLSSEERRWVDV